MLVKALIADDDMDVLQLLDDVLEINFRNLKTERALSKESFWAKVSAEGAFWHLLFLSAEYIKDEPQSFLERLAAANPGLSGKTILTGNESARTALGEIAGRLPFLSKPFSLDQFEELVKSVYNAQ
jgi:DNA-binding NtrC family response regulator